MNATIGKKDGSMSTIDLSYEKLNELFTIDESGNLFWKVSPSRKVKKGSVVGNKNAQGYLRATVDFKEYRCHRIAYILFNNKEIPEGMQIDHIDRNRTNNRKDNLRIVSNRDNQNNRKDQAKYPNIISTKYGTYIPFFKINGKNRYFGSHTLEAALLKRGEIIADFENVCKKYGGT